MIVIITMVIIETTIKIAIKIIVIVIIVIILMTSVRGEGGSNFLTPARIVKILPPHIVLSF